MRNQKRRAASSPIYTVPSYRTEESIGFLLGVCLSRITDAIDRSLGDLGVSAQQFGVLHAILKGRARTPSDLARLRYQNGAAITYTLDVLEGRKLLTRTRNAVDRRGIELDLTAEGSTLTRACIPRMVEAQNRMLEGLDLAEYQVLTVLLRRIAGQAETEDR
jgi:DNA-binding MarR family transcriptional regulator